MLSVTSCWVSCDGLISHTGGSQNTSHHFMMGVQCWDGCPVIPSRSLISETFLKLLGHVRDPIPLPPFPPPCLES